MTDDTMTTERTDTRDPAEIEREIRRTQSEMSRTADRIGDQLTPRKLVDALLDNAQDQGIDARYVLDQARRNPIALGMIALGGLWLVSDSDARASTFSGKFGALSRGSDSAGGAGDNRENHYHAGYVRHMSAIEPQAGEDHDTYRRRRDCARASYLMVEQRHDEDEHSFRKRLDDATDKLRDRRDSMAEAAQDWRERAGQRASGMSEGASRMYQQNPLVGGLIAAVAGAIAGAALPTTRTEEKQLGNLGSQALGVAKDKAAGARQQMVDKADDALSRSDQSGGPERSQQNQPASNQNLQSV